MLDDGVEVAMVQGDVGESERAVAAELSVTVAQPRSVGVGGGVCGDATNLVLHVAGPISLYSNV